MRVQDRQASGSGHGWAGAQMVFWNCEAASIVCQKPPTAQNYCIGSSGMKSGGWHRREHGYWESHGRNVEARTLCLQQLADRLDPEAVRNTATSG